MSTIDKIRKLCTQNPGWIEYFKNGTKSIYASSIDEFLTRLDKNAPPDFSMATLDDYENDQDLAIVLAHLPAEVVHSELGDDALMWTLIKYPYEDQIDVLAEGVQRVTGRIPEHIEKARRTASDFLDTSKVGLIRSVYDLNEEISEGIARYVDLPDFIKRNARPGVELSAQRLNDYSLEPLMTEGDRTHGYDATWKPDNDLNHGKRYVMWLDSPAGLTLTYRDEPNAIVGFFPSAIDTLRITQLQGVKPTIIGIDGEPIGKGSSWGLEPFDWEKLLVEVVDTIGHRLGYAHTEIQSGHNNRWTKLQPGETEIHLTLETALKRYDEVAQRLVFTQAQSKNWLRSLI